MQADIIRCDVLIRLVEICDKADQAGWQMRPRNGKREGGCHHGNSMLEVGRLARKRYERNVGVDWFTQHVE